MVMEGVVVMEGAERVEEGESGGRSKGGEW